MKEHWLDEPEEHDYPAACEYLSLLLPLSDAEDVVASLTLDDVAIRWYKAKDLLRASHLELLPVTNEHVQKDWEKIRRGEKLSPVLLVRGDARMRRPLIVADGYHRICVSYHIDENAEVPCRVANLA